MVPQIAASIRSQATRSNSGTKGGTARCERRDCVGRVGGGCAKGGRGWVLFLPFSRSACFMRLKLTLVPSSFVRQARACSSAPVSGAYLRTSVRYQRDPALDGSAGQSARAQGSVLMSPRDGSPWRHPPALPPAGSPPVPLAGPCRRAARGSPLRNRWRHTPLPPPSPSPQSPPFPCRAVALAATPPRAAAGAWRCCTTRHRRSIDGRAARPPQRLSRRGGPPSFVPPPPTARGDKIDRRVAHPTRGS